MTDVFRLHRVLPAISIQTDEIARVQGGRSDNTIDLLLPPAGWLEPAVKVSDLLTFALIEAGHARADAEAMAAVMAEALLADLPLERRPLMLDSPNAQTVVCAAVTDALRPLFAMGGREAAVADAIWRFADAAACGRVFKYGELGPDGCSLRELGPDPLPAGLTEFWPGIASDLTWRLCEDGNTPALDKMYDWMRGMRPQIEALEAAAGTRLFYFKQPDDELDDDQAHRFLALDYVCHMIPDSDYVAYLAEVSGAPSVAALRAALRAPDAYSPYFRLYYSFAGPQIGRRQDFCMPPLAD